MVRFSKMKIITFFILVWSTCSLATSLNYEDKLEGLINKKFVEMEQAFEAKTKKLEAQVVQFEEKVLDLETKLEQQELLLQKYNTKIYKSTTRGAISRTCHETRLADPSLSSGMYYVDPDGVGMGDDPIYVYCDMTTGWTSVLHDSESQIDVGHCSEPGCYNRIITYSATHRQMVALTTLSHECRQSIKYECVSAPLEINGISYSWWEDRNGFPRYFWSGNNASVHTCQCGIDHSCVEPRVPCNCDSSIQVPMSDDGIITVKNLLPIKKLFFGRTILQSSTGYHTLGRFECKGDVAVDGMPKSCLDLWHIGHFFSGFYSVMGTEFIETVYCDFAKVPDDPGFETWIGSVNIKSVPTYFYVQRNTTFSETSGPVPFEFEKLNIGRAMDLTSGIFTAPRSGRYFFSFSGVATISTPSYGYVYLGLMLNNQTVGEGTADSRLGDREMESFSLQTVLNLSVGDQVWIKISGLINAVLQDSDKHLTHFTGWLIEEDVLRTLNGP